MYLIIPKKAYRKSQKAFYYIFMLKCILQGFYFSQDVIYYIRFSMNFAENLRNELEYQGMQVKELAEKTGLSVNTLNKYRPGSIVTPTVDNALKIAKVLNVSLDFLATGKDFDSRTDKTQIERIAKKIRYFSDSDLNAIESIINSIAEKY